MIYATEQQVVVTAVLIVFCTLVSLFTGIWYGRVRGLEEAAEEEAKWAREQAKARRTHPVYRELPAEESVLYGRRRPRDAREDPDLISKILRQPPEVAHEAWLAHEDQALTLANNQLHDQDCVHSGFPHAGGCFSAAITTGEIQAITDEMDTWLAEHVYSAPTDYGAWLEQNRPPMLGQEDRRAVPDS